jgi:mRNA-degrading endonuclease RelE of RelBE toxin-antitoxin system
MSYSVRTTPRFERSAKRLARKYPHFKDDLRVLLRRLTEDPFHGTAIPGFQHHVWKVRLGSTDMRVGKRGGFRIIYVVRRDTQTIYLVFAYPKSEKADVSPAEIESLLEEIDDGT